MSNYPDSVNPGDPKAPWNEPDATISDYVVELQVRLSAYSEDDVHEILRNRLFSNAPEVFDYRVDKIEVES